MLGAAPYGSQGADFDFFLVRRCSIDISRPVSSRWHICALSALCVLDLYVVAVYHTPASVSRHSSLATAVSSASCVFDSHVAKFSEVLIERGDGSVFGSCRSGE
jgi:hypothetical protein